MNPYYKAYDERYKTIHGLGYSWASDEPTPIVLETIQKYGIDRTSPMLEIGCGEGRDAIPLLKKGYALSAIDVSPEAVCYCKQKAPDYAARFSVLDCLADHDKNRYDFVYAVAVIHMLSLDEDRARFYRFVREHLSEKGIALICTMGDGEGELATDPDEAFLPKERNHVSGKVIVAATTLKMVSFPHFEKELCESGLQIPEKGITGALPDFNQLMYAVVRRG